MLDSWEREGRPPGLDASLGRASREVPEMRPSRWPWVLLGLFLGIMLVGPILLMILGGVVEDYESEVGA